MNPQRKTHELRKGRLSIPNTRIFLTLCTHKRDKGLNKDSLATELIDQFRRLHIDQNIDLYCATVMPDHIHMLFRLGQNLPLPKIITKYKTLTKRTLAEHHLKWQANYYDHRLRSETGSEAFTKYIFLNPYRKQLISTEAVWPYWIINRNYNPELLTDLRNGTLPHPEWLNTAQT